MIRVREAKERATELKRIEKQRSWHQGRARTPTPTLGPIGLNLDPLADIIWQYSWFFFFVIIGVVVVEKIQKKYLLRWAEIQLHGEFN